MRTVRNLNQNRTQHQNHQVRISEEVLPRAGGPVRLHHHKKKEYAITEVDLESSECEVLSDDGRMPLLEDDDKDSVYVGTIRPGLTGPVSARLSYAPVGMRNLEGFQSAVCGESESGEEEEEQRTE